jgi:hypothetical protein
MHTRRHFLQQLVAGSTTLASMNALLRAAEGDEKLLPVRQLTRGPKFHWFGYYDKLQFDPTGRYILGMQVGFEGRSPKPDDELRVGMVDTADNDRWIELGKTTAWGWQQGCMLQWIPGSASEVIWNDRAGDHYISRILDVKSGKERTLPHAIYTLAPDGKTGIVPDFRRLNDVRPGYGYTGIADPNAKELTPRDSGIWKVDLASGAAKLLFSVADLAAFGTLPDDARGAKQWFNHLLFNQDASRFVFLHRWRPTTETTKFRTRMVTSSAAGKDWHVVGAAGTVSHFIWRDPRHLLMWTKPDDHPPGFYLIRDQSDVFEQIGAGVMTTDGHCTYLPGLGDRWILNDTYPDKERLQHPYLFDTNTRTRISLGHFHSPKDYTGEVRCDNHPRFSPDGTKVVIDSPHHGGRQMYLIDVSRIVKG